jgi:4-amino-4-deoxy-L-arabinose transferase-like glycosyltransferase
MSKSVSLRRTQIIVAFLALLLFVPFLGSVRLFDWDEINFAEAAREMIVTGDYLHVQIDYQPFYEKPPLFIWLQAVSMHIFGVNEFAARFVNAVVGAATLIILYTIGASRRGHRFGILWAAAMIGSLLPHFYFRSGIIDPLFNLFIFLSVYWMMRSMEGVPRAALWAGILSGCAVLTKGPVGWGLAMLVTALVWFFHRRMMPLPWKQVLIATALMLGVNALWYGADLAQNGTRFIAENITYQIRLLTTGDAGHEQPFWYHTVVILVGCYPVSILALSKRAWMRDTVQVDTMRIWMIALFIVTLVVFSVVKTKIIHYSSLTYLPLTYLAAVTLDSWLAGRDVWPRWRTITLAVHAVLLASALAAVPWLAMHTQDLLALPTFKDTFLRSSLQQQVAWGGWEVWIPLVLLAGPLAIILWRRSHPARAVGVLFASVAVLVFLVLPSIAPKIEPYTQGAALDFYESLRGKDVYVKPLTMKSYAHIYYTDKPYHLSATAKGIHPDQFEPWLLNGAIDRDAYFVAKVNDAKKWRTHPNLEVVREYGGFVVLKRKR